MLKGKLNQAGDTIVEVLICLVILGTALGAAYAIAARDLGGSRDSQERGEATAYAVSQIEAIRTQPAASIPTGTPFCITGFNTVTQEPGLAPVPPPVTTDPLKNNSATGYDPACISGAAGLYHTFTTYDGAPDNLYTVHVRWFALNSSNQRNEVVEYYRYFP